MAVTRCNELYRKAKSLIPGGTQTISKRPERYVPGKWPAYWDRAEGARIWDLDGNEYLDYVMALGPIVLGYNHPAVNEAIAAQLRKGSITSLQSPLEVALAEKLVEHVPSADMVRFMKTGAEATAVAVRIARAYTNRTKVVSCGYAGWHDWWVAKGSVGSSRGDASMRGVPTVLEALICDLKYGDRETLDEVIATQGDEVACIMIDMFEVNDAGGFLRVVRDAADRIGAVLIFDEIITGFRMGLGGAQGLYGVTPDISTFGKAMANGMPVSATVGKREIMEVAADLWITSTFGGEALSLAAALATIEELEKPETLARLHDLGHHLEKGLGQLTDGLDGVECIGQLSMPGIRFVNGGTSDEEAARDFVARMLKQGILTRPNYVFFVTAALTEEDVARTLQAAERALRARSRVPA
jgi:glutamate-1-semialdehyde aminotransferase